jgi:hypothetical protein
MPIDDRTANRSYQLPNAANLLQDDVPRLRAALQSIDADVTARPTTAEVNQLITDLIAGSPGALDTLNELAAAMGDDPNFAATVATQLSLKANLAEVWSRAEADARYVQGQVQTEMVFIATAGQSAFTLSTPVINKPSALVTVDGVVQSTSSYNLNQTGTVLTLTESVSVGTVVRVLALGVSSEGAPADDTVTTTKLRAAAVTNAKLAFDGGALSGVRNAAINGGFTIWQQGTSFTNPANGSYLASQWRLVWDGSGAARMVTRESAGYGVTGLPVEGASFLRIAQTAAGTGASVNILQQPVEGAATISARAVTLSCYLRAAAPTTLQSIYLAQTFGTGGAPSAPVVVDLVSGLVVGTTWQRFELTATLPSLSGKTLGSNADDALVIGFRLPVNATFTVDLALVQLEQGPSATPFEQRPETLELSLCERYWQAGRVGLDVYEEANRLSREMVRFRVPMRATPIITQSAVDSIEFSATLHASLVTNAGFFAGRTKNGLAGKGTWINYYEASARL